MEFVSSTSWDISELSVEWLQSNIGSRLGGKTIARCAEYPLTAQPMSLGTLKRVKLYFTDETEYSIVVKQESGNVAANKFAAPFYKAEVNFYLHLSRLSRARVPRCFYSTLSRDATSTTLLIESIENASSGDTHVGLSLAQCHSALIELGKFHGSFVNNSSVPLHAKTAAEHMSAATPEQWLPLFMSTWRDFIASSAPSAEAADKVTQVFEHCAIHSSNWTVMLGLMGATTLIHGDYKGTNLMFSSRQDTDVTDDAGGDGDVAGGIKTTILDFQTVYIGGDIARADDVMYLIVGSLDSDTRTQHEEALITPTGFHRYTCHTLYWRFQTWCWC
jgi:hypothetical protein